MWSWFDLIFKIDPFHFLDHENLVNYSLADALLFTSFNPKWEVCLNVF